MAEIQKGNMMSCPECAESMSVMGATPSNDGRVVKLYLVCETCQMFAVADAKISGRIIVNHKGDEVA